MMTVQETVSDPYDILNSLVKYPPVHLLDDACTYVRHSMMADKVKGQLAFGTTHGCFELPDENKEPTQNIDCPAIEPLSHSDGDKTNREAMLNPSPLVHPDVQGLCKFCMGTRLQMRSGKSSHQLKTCRFHDVNLSIQGKLVKSMTQEALQVDYLSNKPTHHSCIYFQAE
jgi:hypothetical protein